VFFSSRDWGHAKTTRTSDSAPSRKEFPVYTDCRSEELARRIAARASDQTVRIAERVSPDIEVDDLARACAHIAVAQLLSLVLAYFNDEDAADLLEDLRDAVAIAEEWEEAA
jgi:hypothetical protein